MRRSLGAATLVLILVAAQGCGMTTPRNFRKIQHPAPMVRARALSLGDRRPGAQVVPALVGRLDDPDPVVRLAAHEELKQRTGQDFGYLPWEEEPERRAAVERWREWLGGKPPAAVPAPTPQHQPTTQIRRTIRK
ncbi:HEAT repeat domain-containing protein [Paludisphaera mucosa]|uniref:HEAT repeat domain-containing protein n=1 Tax=Paludisphaera mucosa TaxID=3030827 RepID=A0ABT6FAW4_9BACT|nr:HEAT repeat domain-containing protein [Paludisphaera mucosa]MDG3004732.1 HEAT repeat domain-containing protein [Paludisphaera mucosa]